MSRKFLTIILWIFSLNLFSQEKDAIVILFDDHHQEMERIDFTHLVQPDPVNNIFNKSVSYIIRQMEEESYYDNKFRFTHLTQPEGKYDLFGGKPPIAKKITKEFLKDSRVLDIQFFRATPYLEVCKTFEEEDSWQQDVLIFMVDVDEIINDSIVLREVSFSRPVKP